MLSMLLFLVLLASPALAGQVLHVRTTGHDTQGDGTAAKPWRTIAQALRNVKPGDTVQLGPGK